MNLHRVSYVVFFLAVTITVEGSVSFQGTTVTLTCPNEDIYSGFEWKKEYKIIENKKQATYSLPKYTNKEDGLYSCTGTEESSGESITHYFYIKAKVCDGCVDLDMNLALVVVFADMLLTLVIAFMVYYCTRKNAGTAGPQRPTQARQARAQARGPPPPDPDYQPLNQTTRSADVYATAHRR